MRRSLHSTRCVSSGAGVVARPHVRACCRVQQQQHHQQQRCASSLPSPSTRAAIANGGLSGISEQHQQQQQQQATPLPQWALRSLRLAAATALLLGASAAAGPSSVRAARAAALQPPQQSIDSNRRQQQPQPQQQPSQQQQQQQQQQRRSVGASAGPMPLATVSALPSSQTPSSAAQQHASSGTLQQHTSPSDGVGSGGAAVRGGGGDMQGGSTPASADGASAAGAAGTSAGLAAAAAGAGDLLAVERRAMALFEANKASVVSVGHVRSMHHFHTLDVGRMAPGQGTGFIWDRAGHVVVAAHTVRGASEVKVTLPDASTATARVVGADAVSDIAVLQLALPRTRTEALRPVALGASAGLRIGQMVWVIGNPWGLEHTLSQGLVSGLGREMGGAGGLWSLKGCIQTDATVNVGNSGGPLLDSSGRVVGVALALHNGGGGAGGRVMGHAAPIDAARRVVEQLLAHGRVKRPSLGIVPAPPQVLAGLGGEGVLALEVPAGSPAAAAGLRATYRDVFGDIVLGDVIVGIDTRPVRGLAELLAALDDKRPGDRVRCDVLRDGKRLSMTVLLGERAPGAAEE